MENDNNTNQDVNENTNEVDQKCVWVVILVTIINFKICEMIRRYH